MYNVLEDCHHGPKPPPSAQITPAAADHADHGKANPSAATAAAAAKHAQRAARYAAVLAAGKGWPAPGAVPQKGVVLNWAHVMKGLGHNPPCTGACVWFCFQGGSSGFWWTWGFD
jgi:hypothetical protein